MINAVALSQVRTQRGLSQRKFAALIGLNYQVVARLERGGDDGNLTLRDFEKICTALEASPASLLEAPDRAAGAGRQAAAHGMELDLSQARVLRRVQRSEDPRRVMSAQERQTVLPSLMRLGLIQTRRGATLHLSPQALADLRDPESIP